ncbi:Alcohol dehydrogenase C-terminal [Trinorchestia longiramus]|nr:Alcohol dehydrogenase C-terminal [Trinorchestia longiramus]
MAPNKENLAAVLYGINDMRLENREVPKPGDHDVLLRMGQVGICGSDVSYLTKGRIGHFIVEDPMVLGHEASGTVVECGAKVTKLKPGDRVAIEPGVPCRRCNFCKSGRYNLCKTVFFCATPPDHGNLCRYYVHDADFCFKLPDHVSLEEGAFLEPLSVGVHAARRAGVTLGSRVLVCGAGPIGLVSMMAARSMGATHICCTDICEKKLAFAKSQGADSTVLVTPSSSSSDLAAAVTEQMGGRQPDVSIECCGAESSIKLAIQATESGGVVVLVGMGPPEVKVPLVDAAIREVDIRGIFRYVNCYPLSLELIASGRVDVKPLITHRFTLAEAQKAFDTARTGEGGPIKIMIDCEK